MFLRVLYIFLFIFSPALSSADVSISSDANRKVDSTETDAIKKDKSLTVDKSQGSRKSNTHSEENSVEGSDSRAHSSRSHKSNENQNSSSVDLNLNALLLQKFIERYESKSPDETMTKAQFVFAECKPLTGLASEFPILNGCPTKGAAALDLDFIVPLSKATRFLDCGTKGGYYKRQEKLDAENADGVSYSDGIKDYGYMTKNPVNPQNEYVSKYARCRIIASKWVGEAAQRVELDAPENEEAVARAIESTYQTMDQDEKLFLSIAKRSAEIWSHARCTPWLTIARDFDQPHMTCGVLNIEGDEAPRIVLQGRLTLSEQSIEGRSYKLAVSSSTSVGSSNEDTTSSDKRTAHADRNSQSTDDFSEGKKTATLSKSKNLDSTQSSDVNRSSGSSTSASPEK